MTLDIFNPTISVVPKGLEGKTILLYGSNSLGKTKQASQMSKPFYLGFEKGLNAISGIPFKYITKWADFKKINKQFSGKDSAKAREMYDTIIFDTVDIASIYCQNFVSNQHGVNTIGEGNGGFGLWKQYEQEFWGEIDKLTSVGYTVVFIGHTDEDKNTEQIIPKGDKRSMGIVRDLVDITVYLKSNGVDEDGNVILSTGYIRETPEFFARSRFDLMPNKIEPFTAENLKQAVITGIEREEAAGGTTVSYEEFVENTKSTDLNFGELKEKLIDLGKAYMEADRLEDFKETMSDKFGEGTQVNDLKEKQVEAISVIVDELHEQLNK
ncbi:ATP-binding protein [Mammaliicoccus lentus]|uniref:ATP-binding protein n=1 Tax=Mammaliicoccus lentus TaxID=42858 RepID=UPI001072BBCB|nr:ATP-binding protein [Mammaliicoccus lentus]MBF0793379.1 ATP-binding protein [Mammaliicoccus lentus]TFV17880.1 ATP-binding protein [Mammaliicoccus lentus]